MNYKQTVVVGLLVVSLLAGGAAVATAQESPPGEPASFYGTAQDEDGEDAPEGTEIYAVVLDENGDVTDQSSITVVEAGTYGGPDSFDDKLRVDSTAGTEVAFRVNSAEGRTAATIDLESGTQNVDLTFPAGSFLENPDDTVSSGGASVGDDGIARVTLPSGGNAQSVRVNLPGNTDASRVTVTESLSPTGGAPTPSNNVAVYLDIAADATVTDDVEVTVTIDESALDDAGISVENTALLHYNDGSWNELATDASSDGSGSVTINATSNGLSPFAIAESSDTGGDTGDDDDDDDTDASTGGGGGGGGGGGSLAADFLATNLDPTTTEVTQGDTISVSAEIESDGIAQDTQDVDLRIGGETIATQSVELSSDATTTVEFTDVTVDVDAGEYEYGVYTDDDSVTGTITVVADETADEEAAADEEADEEADAEPADEEGTAEAQADGATEDGIPGFGPLVAVLALVALALAARRNQ